VKRGGHVRQSRVVADKQRGMGEHPCHRNQVQAAQKDRPRDASPQDFFQPLIIRRPADHKREGVVSVKPVYQAAEQSRITAFMRAPAAWMHSGQRPAARGTHGSQVSFSSLDHRGRETEAALPLPHRRDIPNGFQKPVRLMNRFVTRRER
jgi:hypothetical protein